MEYFVNEAYLHYCPDMPFLIQIKPVQLSIVDTYNCLRIYIIRSTTVL